MSRIDVHAMHRMKLEDAQNAADQLAQDLARKFDIEYGWDEDTIVFERPGIHGTITIDAKEIRILAQLGLMLSMFRDRLEAEVRRYLAEHFNCTFKV